MKKIEYLSPSSISTWKRSDEEFYLQYLCNVRPPRDPQTQPMGCGSAFDAYVKSFLHEALFGKNNDPRFDFESLFAAQVEPHNRDFCLTAGKRCFDWYKSCGALSDLLLELQHAIGKPKFEIEVRGVVSGYREGIIENIGGVTFLGKPDLFFTNKHGTSIIHDWKVTGYCADRKIYPSKGYVRYRGLANYGAHKEAVTMMFGGTLINALLTLEEMNHDWAQQLSIYSWLCGANVGEEFVASIDQLICSPDEIKTAEHRLKVSPKFQYETFAYAQKLWEIVHSDHIFREMSKEQSQARCQILDTQGPYAGQPQSDLDAAFDELTKPNKRFF